MRRANRMKRANIYRVCLVLLLAGMFTGCGKSGGKGADREETAQEQQEGESQIQQGNKEKEGDDGQVHLRVWAGEEDEALLAEISKRFIAEHAGEADITIDWEPMVEGQCRPGVLGDILHAPDIYTTIDGDIRALAAGGAAAAVLNPDEIRENNMDAAVKAVTVGDDIYGYPVTADNGYFLYYNKAYFSESDVTDLDKMLEIADKHCKQFAMDWSSGWYLYAFFGQTGLTVGANSDGVTNFCDWNSTENEIRGVDVAEALLDIASHKSFVSTPDWLTGIKSGQVIACVSGVWDETVIKELWGDNYGAAKLPCYTVNEKKVQMACYFGYKVLGVNPYSRHVMWAHKFADYVANEENQKLRFAMRGQGPSNKRAALSPEIQEAVAVQAMLAQSEFSEPQRLGYNFWEPATLLGNTLAAHNPENLDLQELLDTVVSDITSSTVQ